MYLMSSVLNLRRHATGTLRGKNGCPRQKYYTDCEEDKDKTFLIEVLWVLTHVQLFVSALGLWDKSVIVLF